MLVRPRPPGRRGSGRPCFLRSDHSAPPSCWRQRLRHLRLGASLALVPRVFSPRRIDCLVVHAIRGPFSRSATPTALHLGADLPCGGISNRSFNAPSGDDGVAPPGVFRMAVPSLSEAEPRRRGSHGFGLQIEVVDRVERKALVAAGVAGIVGLMAHRACCSLESLPSRLAVPSRRSPVCCIRDRWHDRIRTPTVVRPTDRTHGDLFAVSVLLVADLRLCLALRGGGRTDDLRRFSISALDRIGGGWNDSEIKATVQNLGSLQHRSARGSCAERHVAPAQLEPTVPAAVRRLPGCGDGSLRRRCRVLADARPVFKTIPGASPAVSRSSPGLSHLVNLVAVMSHQAHKRAELIIDISTRTIRATSPRGERLEDHHIPHRHPSSSGSGHESVETLPPNITTGSWVRTIRGGRCRGNFSMSVQTREKSCSAV